MHSNIRKAIVGVCAVALAGAGIHLATTAEAATPTEVTTIPPDTMAAMLPDTIQFAGATGFLHRYTTDGPQLWVRYADGVTTTLSEPVPTQSAGGDSVWTTRMLPGHSTPGNLTVVDLAKMEYREFPLPSSGSVAGFFGSTMLIKSAANSSGPVMRMRRFADDGSAEDVPVTGIPAGTAAARVETGDTTSAVLAFFGPGIQSDGLLDLATGAVAPIPDGPYAAQVLLSADGIALSATQTNTQPVRVFSRSGIATGSDTSAQTYAFPSNTTHRVALVGTHLVAISADSTPKPLIDYTAPGRPTVIPLVQQSYTFAQNSDGALVVGGSGAGDWSVRRLTYASGQVSQSPVLRLIGPVANAGVSIARGIARHIEVQQLPGDSGTWYQMFNHQLVPEADGSQLPLDGGTLPRTARCESEPGCLRTVDGNNAGTSYLVPDPGGLTLVRQNGLAQTQKVLPSVSGVIVDASPNYVIVNGSGPDTQYVVSSDANPVTSRPLTGAALWFDTLYSGVGPGSVEVKNLATGVSEAVLPIGATCTPAELQAAQRYLYWSCGTAGPAGVYDLAKNTNISVPAAQYLLGDGYLVRHDGNGSLLRYDLTSGTLGGPAQVASIDRGNLTDDRGITWAVDKYSGNIAYVDAYNTVHVVDAAVPTTAPAAVSPPASAPNFYYGSPWALGLNLTRPIQSSTLTVTQVSTGKVVATRTGGPSRTQLVASWDGYTNAQVKVPSGRYRYTLTATATGAPTATVASGTVTVQCGIPNYHSYRCNGLPVVLAVYRSGEAHWLTIDNGKISDSGNVDTWVTNPKLSQYWSAIVPFGDLNRDGYNDVVAREYDGYLDVFYGYSTQYPGTGGRRILGTGWNMYKQLISTGDLTGDGIPDLLAQDKNGKLWRYNGTKTGTFAARVAIAGTYPQPKLIGPGDWNGDGKADLMMINTSGTLYVVYGSGTGTFGGAHQIGSGWASSTLVIGAGDLNQDGRNDLAARDSAGNFWMYPGNGKGGFGARKRLATGYQKYAGLF